MLATLNSKLLTAITGVAVKLDLYTESGPFSGDCLLDANNDLDVVLKWLELYKDKTTTHSTYKREAIRFLLWCACEAGKNLSALKVDDLQAYLEFLQNPPQAWCTSRAKLRGAKNTGQWRPFIGPLSLSAYQCSVRVLNSLFNYLVQADYLRSNPLKLLRVSQSFNMNTEDRKYQVWARMLEEDEWQAILQVLDNMPEGNKDAVDLKIRTQFLVAMLYLLGLRISEIASHSWNAFRQKDGKWWFFVKGKGDKFGHIPVNDKLLDYVRAYRLHLSLDEELPQVYETQRLIVSYKTGKAYQLRVLYNMVKDVGLAAAKQFPKNKQKQAKLKKFSPHWLRHLSASHQDKAGLSMGMIQENMRHGSANTARIYMHSEDKARHEAIQDIEFNDVRVITAAPKKTGDILTIKVIKSNGINSTRAFMMFIQAIEQNVLPNLEFKADKTIELRLAEFEKEQKMGLAYEFIERQLSLPVALPHQKSNFYLDIASYKIEPFVN